MERFKARFDPAIWSSNLVALAATVFLINFGSGLTRGVASNFFIDTLGISGGQVLALTGLREIPGLALMFIAALIMHWPLRTRAAVAVLIMGFGYALYATVGSYTGLVAVAIVGSLGFHVWMPLQNALAMSLVAKEHSGRVMGALSSVRSLSAIIGVGAVALVSLLFADMNLRIYYVIAGVLIALGATQLLRLPTIIGADTGRMPRMLIRRRYWLYYVLTFFEGSRMQVFGAFGTMILVRDYGLEAWQISLVLLASSVMNLFASPILGRMLDRLGERIMLSGSYVLLALCFVGYASFHNPWLLAALLIGINVLVILRMGLTTYVNRIAPPDELTPTLSAGVSINHITSVGMSLLAGYLLELVGYEALCWGAAAIIMVSVPFALAIRLPRAQAVPATAE